MQGSVDMASKSESLLRELLKGPAAAERRHGGDQPGSPIAAAFLHLIPRYGGGEEGSQGWIDRQREQSAGSGGR